jgi:hypothetical protein
MESFRLGIVVTAQRLGASEIRPLKRCFIEGLAAQLGHVLTKVGGLVVECPCCTSLWSLGCAAWGS